MTSFEALKQQFTVNEMLTDFILTKTNILTPKRAPYMPIIKH